MTIDVRIQPDIITVSDVFTEEQIDILQKAMPLYATNSQLGYEKIFQSDDYVVSGSQWPMLRDGDRCFPDDQVSRKRYADALGAGMDVFLESLPDEWRSKVQTDQGKVRLIRYEFTDTGDITGDWHTDYPQIDSFTMILLLNSDKNVWTGGNLQVRHRNFLENDRINEGRYIPNRGFIINDGVTEHRAGTIKPLGVGARREVVAYSVPYGTTTNGLF